MKEYQAVIVRFEGRSRDDEELLTDLLNERARMGWTYSSVNYIGSGRAAVIFSRDA